MPSRSRSRSRSPRGNGPVGEQYRVVESRGAKVREKEAMDSPEVGMLKHEDLVTVVKTVGKRAQITTPLVGWVSLYAGSASKPIIEPTAKKEAPKATGEAAQKEAALAEELAARADKRRENTNALLGLKSQPVKVTGDAPEHMEEWAEGVQRKILHDSVKTALEQEGLATPTQIQKYAIPIILSPKKVDLLASAQTGSGKTFAFVIPLVNIVAKGVIMRPYFPGAASQASPVSLVLSPTRELAIQTAKEAMGLVKNIKQDVNVMAIYGGESMPQQLKPIEKKNVDILSATPGRLVDAIDHGKVTLMFTQICVLDEADKMMEQGMAEHLNEIMTGRDLPEKGQRQTLLFSATFPPQVKEVCDRVLRSGDGCIRIQVGEYREDKGGSTAKIKQWFRQMRDDDEKVRACIDDVQRYAPKKVIIFSNRIKHAVQLGNDLYQKGILNG